MTPFAAPPVSDPVRPKLLDHFPESGHVVIEASAGTGKTFTLECLVAHLLATEAATLDQILVVTFTEKATEELRGRLRNRLEALVRGNGEHWPLSPDERNHLERAANEFEIGTISTIHGWCSKVLEENAFYQNRLFEETLIDGRDAFRKAFRRQLRTALASDDSVGIELRALLEDQQTLGRLERLALQLAESRARVTPECDLPRLRSVASEAALAIQENMTALLDPIKNHYGRSTATRLRQKLGTLRSTAESLSVCQELPFDTGEQLARWFGTVQKRDSLGDLLEPVAFGSQVARGQRDQLISAIEELEQAACSRLAFVVRKLAETTAATLKRDKRKHGQHDYDDLLLLLVEALRGPSGASLLSELRSRYRVVLIDEFQDTDEVQWEIFRRVFFDSPDGHRIIVIGDPKQAIYGFRNADVATYCRARDQLREAKESAEAPAGTVGSSLALVENFRSTERLVAAQNQLFSNFFTDGTHFALAQTGRPALATITEGGLSAQPIGLFPFSEGDDIARRLASGIAQEIRELTAGKLRLQDESGTHCVAFDDIQILTRTRAEAIQIGDTLGERDIPYVFYGQEGLYASEEAEDLAALLAAIARPSDRARRAQAWLTPFFDVALADLPALQAAVDRHPGGHPYATSLYRWNQLARNGDLTFLFHRIIEESGVVRRARFLGGRGRQLTNYRHLFEELLAVGRRIGADLQELPDRLARLAENSGAEVGDRDQQRLDQQGQAVRIMTLHKAKGLEAPIVFIFGGWVARNDDLRLYHYDGERCIHVGAPPPSVRARARAEARAETERLVYVGVTRAAHRLYLPCFEGRSGPKRSSFLRPLNDRILQFRGGSDTSDLFEEIPLSGEVSLPTLPDPEVVASWQPNSAPDEEQTWSAERLAELRQRHAAPFVTSYTQLSSRSSQVSFEESMPPLADELPGGRATGIFLHELLERLDFAAILEAPSVDTLFSRAPTADLYSRLAVRHSIESVHQDGAQRLIYSGLRTPIDLPGLTLPRGLAALEDYSRELEFLFPTPSPGNEAREGSVAYPVGKAYIQGVVDLLFQEGPRYYVLDWKSDRRDSWGAPELARHVEDHYDTQASLYSLALARVLGLRSESDFEERFGGILYCFLRGMNPQAVNQGIYFQRPTWQDLRRWTDEIETLEAPSVYGEGR